MPFCRQTTVASIAGHTGGPFSNGAQFRHALATVVSSLWHFPKSHNRGTTVPKQPFVTMSTYSCDVRWGTNAQAK
ncbi:MAG: hypothetical protein WBE86_06375 [Candidatus Acidiferrales bacterium]